MNKLTDMDWGWWPFLSLKPKQTEHITSGLLFKMTIYYGLTYGVLIYFITMPKEEHFSMIDFVVFMFIVFVVFFILYKFTFAYYWNRRADRLSKKFENI